jgi:hypothetical protein
MTMETRTTVASHNSSAWNGKHLEDWSPYRQARQIASPFPGANAGWHLERDSLGHRKWCRS